MAHHPRGPAKLPPGPHTYIMQEPYGPPAGPDFVAQKHSGYWTIQVACATGARSYVIRMEDGALFELPDDRVPFVTFPVDATPKV